ncbi:hypothetical protein [Acidaminococcus timonensis]|uniref:hypothetical protein n=1 Tax=Acidaminococcus timonensis TaxID=1871002 RepID=UPI003079F446
MYYMFMGTMQVPIPPATLRTRIRNRNRVISLVNRGEINILKATGLTEITFKMLLPNANYPFNQSIMGKGLHASFYIDQLEKMKLDSDPFQFIIFFIARIGGIHSNTFQLKMLGKSLLKVTLIMMAASAFIDKTGFVETLMKKYLLKAPKSLITFAVAFMAASIG